MPQEVKAEIPGQDQLLRVGRTSVLDENADGVCANAFASESHGAASGFIWGDGGTEPITCCHMFCMLVCGTVPNLVALALVSDVGIGIAMYSAVAPPNVSLGGDAFVLFSVVLMLVLYVLDWRYWRSVGLKVIASFFPLLLITAGAFAKGRKYPWAPLYFTLFMIPFMWGALRASFCKRTARRQFYACCSAVSGISCVALLLVWVLWMFVDGHQWNRDTKDALVARSSEVYAHIYWKIPLDYKTHCHPDLKYADLRCGLEEYERLKAACSQAASVWFIAWMSPAIAALSNAVICIFCMLSGMVVTSQDSDSLTRALKVFLIGVALLFGGMYACVFFTTLALNLAFVVALGLAMLGLVVWALLEIGPEALVHMAADNHYVHLLAQAWQSDYIRAFAVCPTFFAMPVYLSLNRLNQRVRKCRGTHDNDGRYTLRAEWLLTEIETWNWCSIFTTIALYAELWFILQVGVSKVTYIFLSWLSVQLETIGFGIVCGLVFLVGNLMYLLPPVPGIPIYIFHGIVIVDQASRKLNPMGFVKGLCVALTLSFLNKLCACCEQYALGFVLGKSVKVQQLIHVDSVLTRSIIAVVERPGFNFWKVAMLVGGPDWPVSVGCGIARVNIAQMIIGTLPVILISTPCVVAGGLIAIQGAHGPDSIWPMLANLSLLISGAAQAVAFAAAFWGIVNEVQENGDEHRKYRPEHAAVAELTRQGEYAAGLYEEITKWSNLSRLDKAIVLCMTGFHLIGFAFFCKGSVCFRSFSVDKRIEWSWEEGGLNGDMFSIIRYPLGHAVLFIFAVAVILHILHMGIMWRRLNARLRSEPPLLEAELAQPAARARQPEQGSREELSHDDEV